MALVNCPECGRENVSDSAEQCPSCGFGVKKFFEKIELEKERIKKEKALQEKQKSEERKRLEDKKKIQKETVSSLEEQIKECSKDIRNSAIVFAISLPLTIISFCLSTHGDLGVVIAICGLAAILSGIMLFCSVNNKNECESDLRMAKRDLDLYEKNLQARLKAIAASGEQYRAKNEAKHPKCPQCGGRNTQRISTINRTISVATVGLASSKIGKQYECKNCKHKW